MNNSKIDKNINEVKINVLKEIVNYKIKDLLNNEIINNIINKYKFIKNDNRIMNFIKHISNNDIKLVKIKTEYPGGFYFIYIINNELKIYAINSHTTKISINEQEKFMYKIFENIDLNKYYIEKNIQINFSKFFICLENLRDIHDNIIRKLINNNSFYKNNKIGSFGFVPPNKPFREKFINLCEKYPNKLMYIKTPVYSKNNPNILSWFDIKRNFKYIIDLPGHSYTTKLYTLLFTKRLIFLIGNKRNFMFDWEYKLKPYVHFIPIRRDFSNIIEKFIWVEKNPNKVDKIINNAYQLGMNELHPNKMKEILINNIFTKII